MSVPTATVYEFSRDGSGYEKDGLFVYAIQKALNATAAKPENKITVDSSFGEETETAVIRFQQKKGIGTDGKVGGQTSAALFDALEPKVRSATIPPKILISLVDYESSRTIGAVNNAVSGGRDLSYCQRRVLESDYDDTDVVWRAVDPLYQMNLFASRLRDRHDVYWTRIDNPDNPNPATHEWAWRLSTLYHNYPYGADQISLKGIHGLSSYWYNPQAWVTVHNVKFEDGAPVTTPLQWCQRYALGSSDHNEPGQAVKLVTQWIS